MPQQDLTALLFESTTDALAAISADGRVLSNNFAALKWLPQLNLRDLFNEAQRQGFNQPGKFILMQPSPFPTAEVRINWLGSDQNKVLITVREENQVGQVNGLLDVDFQASTGQAQATQANDVNNQAEIKRGSAGYQGSTSFTNYNPQPTNTDIPHTGQAASFLTEACELARLGIFHINLETGVNIWTPTMYSILGIQPMQNPSLAVLERYIHSDYRKQVMGQLYQAINDTEAFEAHFLTTHPNDASLRPMFLKATIKRDNYGVATTLLGILQAGINDLGKNEESEAEAQNIRQAAKDIDALTVAVAQDMKEPISSISIIIKDIEEEMGPLVSPHSKAKLDTLKGIGTKVEGMLDGLLIYSQSVRAAAELTWIDTEQLVHNCLEYLQVPAHVRVEMPVIWPTIYQDKWRITQILNSLITNAIKFNHNDRPIVKIEILAKTEGITLTVQDNGPGIPAEHLDHVFDLFYTANTKHRTSGVGLSIVQKILTNIGGHAEIASTSHTGTIVTVQIPCQVGPPKPKVGSVGFTGMGR